ncbi:MULTISPECIES: Fur family transcriptional regulator [Desulfosediminicola]|uniref:Fur family transcriptional regulator n=1 Tax=Desulfosediminicola TaxID=2886823 RepID=UPI001E4EB4EB|nr:transcriptional repressor [Desulfosediminicola ganghwensis]
MQLRMTNQREIILRELRESKQHLTADELYERVKKVMPRISLATVYRNLEVLSGAGIIAKLEISGRQKRFDYDVSEHDHICCVKCHRVDNLELDRDKLGSIDWENTDGYSVKGYRLEVAGICPKCQKELKFKEKVQ